MGTTQLPHLCAALCAGLCAALLASSVHADSPLDQASPEDILARFASMPGLSADFREEKRITLLREPLVSRGSILFAPPDRLLLQVASPIPSTVLLEGDRLSLASGGDRQSLYIGSHPLLKGMSESIRLLLAGDTATLEQRFEMRSQQRSDGREGWELVLAPREAPLRSSIRSMRICGMASKLAEFEVSEANGDSTTLVFSSVNASRNFSASEIAEIFRLPAR